MQLSTGRSIPDERITEMKTYCNPLDFSYRYQHHNEMGTIVANREGADPTIILFKGTYYMFVSMSAGFWYSEDLLNWKFHGNKDLLIYDYAPDVRQIGEYMYFCASRREENCPILRTTDPLSDVFEEVSAPFPFWDPNLFCDDDGRVYLYWGCSNKTPIYGTEMDPDTMTPIGETCELIWGRPDELGIERPGENGVVKLPQTEREKMIAAYVGSGPFIEGAFMNKHNGRYYLQYACPGTQYNTYADGVYVSDKPLGPFKLQSHNPFSSKPGGFISGAGHGSTIQDKAGNWWHAATMRISVNHSFERRVGLFPAGFDRDGVLFCNQNFADYPIRIPEGKFDPWSLKPEWMLLSYGKPVAVSSSAPESDPQRATDEDIRTWWSAATDQPGEWLQVDLGSEYDVRAIQVNFADENVPIPQHDESDFVGNLYEKRYIDTEPHLSRFIIESSSDGAAWSVLETVERECSNAYFEFEAGLSARFIKVTALELPYGQTFRVSGLRVFGNGNGEKPAKTSAHAERIGDLDAMIRWNRVPEAQGYNIRYGIAHDKLYSSWMIYGCEELKLSTLIKGQSYYICVDSFNENGITEGDIIQLI